MAINIPPPPLTDPAGSQRWQDWFNKLQKSNGPAGIAWTSVDKAGSNLSDLVTRQHNTLQTMQGGAVGDYQHLTTAQVTALTNAASLTYVNALALSGVYTPTLTNVTNAAFSTTRIAQYSKVGNTITVSGQIDVQPIAAGAIEVCLSIPVASTFTTVYQLGGVAHTMNLSGMGAGIQADNVNSRASMRWVAVDTVNRTMCYTFTYQVV